jgi:hypothetical protein
MEKIRTPRFKRETIPEWWTNIGKHPNVQRINKARFEFCEEHWEQLKALVLRTSPDELPDPEDKEFWVPLGHSEEYTFHDDAYVRAVEAIRYMDFWFGIEVGLERPPVGTQIDDQFGKRVGEVVEYFTGTDGHLWAKAKLDPYVERPESNIVWHTKGG